MPAIQVQQLHKSFTTKRKAAGLGGSLRALVRPEQQIIEAVRGLAWLDEPSIGLEVAAKNRLAADSRRLTAAKPRRSAVNGLRSFEQPQQHDEVQQQ